MRVTFDFLTEKGIRNYGEFVERAADLVVSYGGSLSGEHGDGQSRGALLPKMFGPELMQAFREFKAVWDPGNRMNPHKVVDAYLPTENLRLGADYAPLATRRLISNFVDDGGSFAEGHRAMHRTWAPAASDSGTMCPSYMATLEEEHSTRGRAHMLFEMLQGEVIDRGWQNEEVKKSLDLCLACKACKSECPANVDLATYKAEFLSHYYEKQTQAAARACVRDDRPVGAGWLRMRPAIANFLSNAPGCNQILRRALGLAPETAVASLCVEQLSTVGP